MATRDVDADLWTRLRAIYLTKVWAAHCDVHHGGPTPSPTSIAAATLHSAILAMRTEFTAAYTAPAGTAVRRTHDGCTAAPEP